MTRTAILSSAAFALALGLFLGFLLSSSVRKPNGPHIEEIQAARFRAMEAEREVAVLRAKVARRDSSDLALRDSAEALLRQLINTRSRYASNNARIARADDRALLLLVDSVIADHRLREDERRGLLDSATARAARSLFAW